MFSAILIILTMAFGDLAKLRGIQFKPLNKAMFFIFVGNLLLLMVLGAKHVESPFIEIGQIATLVYFGYFVVTVPMSTIFENSINEFYTQIKGKLSKFYKSTQYYNQTPPAPYNFVTKELKSGLTLAELAEVLSEITNKLPEYSESIKDFNNTVSHNKIDSACWDKPVGMSDVAYNEILNKLTNLSDIIQAKKNSINELFQKGYPKAISLPDNNHLSEKFKSTVQQFSDITSKYKYKS